MIRVNVHFGGGRRRSSHIENGHRADVPSIKACAIGALIGWRLFG